MLKPDYNREQDEETGCVTFNENRYTPTMVTWIAFKTFVKGIDNQLLI